MPITVATLDQLVDQCVAFFSARFPTKDIGSESWLGKQARAIAMSLLSIQKAQADADADASPSTRSSRDALEGFAYLFGLPSNSATAPYGSNVAVPATGGAGNCTGTKGTSFADGLLLLGPDGVTQFKLSGTVVIPGSPPGSGSIAGVFVAVTGGLAGNLPSGTSLTWISPPAGADAAVVLTTGLTGGEDDESDADLLERLLARLQQVPKGGAEIDYRFWCEDASAIVDRAYVYPVRGGLGTVHAVITQAGASTGSTTTRKPSAGVQTAVQASLDVLRPVTVEEATVLLPALASTGHTVRVRVVPSASKYAFDWDDTPTSYTASSWAAGPPATLRITPESTSLQAAVTAGLLPRIQIEITGGPVVPVPCRVTAYASAGSYATLTLEDPLPTGFLGGASSVTNGNKITASGPIAYQLGTAVLTFVDSLGPSRAQFENKTTSTWEDTLGIGRIIGVVMTEVDVDTGVRLCQNTVASGVTINGGTGDVQGSQDLLGSPELLFATYVVVQQ